MTLADQIREVLGAASAPMTTREIALAVDNDAPAAWQVLDRMRAAGEVERIGGRSPNGVKRSASWRLPRPALRSALPVGDR
ncbi:MAG: hypothetical protein ACHP7N_11320 [Caulobacterales bacterium]